MKRPASTRPGTTPAMKRRVIDSLMVTPYTIRMSEGGIISPRVAAPARVPIVMYSG